jgi:O-methyltransferase
MSVGTSADSPRVLPRGSIRALVNRSAALRVSSTARTIRRRRLTYLSPVKLRNLERCLANIRRHRIPGDLIEAGVALGGSAHLLASHVDATPGIQRRFVGYDTFGMIPPPSDRDGADAHERHQMIASGASRGIGSSDVYYGYVDDLYGQVKHTFASLGTPVDDDRIALVQGLFEKTLCQAPPESIALAHVDCDWFEPVSQCLEAIGPVLAPGGFIVIDDYGDYDGCRWAVHEFLARRPEFRITTVAQNLVLQSSAH